MVNEYYEKIADGHEPLTVRHPIYTTINIIHIMNLFLTFSWQFSTKFFFVFFLKLNLCLFGNFQRAVLRHVVYVLDHSRRSHAGDRCCACCEQWRRQVRTAHIRPQLTRRWTMCTIYVYKAEWLRFRKCMLAIALKQHDISVSSNYAPWTSAAPSRRGLLRGRRRYT